MFTSILVCFGWKKIPDREQTIIFLESEIGRYKKDRDVLCVERDTWKDKFEQSMDPVYREAATRPPAPLHITCTKDRTFCHLFKEKNDDD